MADEETARTGLPALPPLPLPSWVLNLGAAPPPPPPPPPAPPPSPHPTTTTHAHTLLCLPADEKYNFERLQASTVLNRQPLLAPQPLDLSPTEELTVR